MGDMSDQPDPTVFMSRIHTPGCPWTYTSDCIEQFAELRAKDPEAAELLEAKARLAFTRGFPATTNNENPQKKGYPTHRCPVGDRVKDLPDVKFDDRRPMHWAGELYSMSDDERTMYRLYFIEQRPKWNAPTERIVGSGIGVKPVDEAADWTSANQTQDIHDAMDSGVTTCENTRTRWRRWNSA